MRWASALGAIAILAAAAGAGQPAKQATGIVKVVTPGLAVELKAGGKRVALPNGQDVSLPVGSYEPASMTYFAPDPGDKSKSAVWSIRSTGGFGKYASIGVREGAPATIDAGPPLALKARFTPYGGSSSQLLLQLQVIGKAGEQYNAATIQRGGAPVRSPQFRIVDEKGAVVGQGVLTKGDYSEPSYIWQLPPDFKGKVQVQFSATLGPIPWKSDETWHNIR
jgi:hypothetical protein